MTQVVEAPTAAAVPGGLYSSPRGLYSFQEDGIARAYLKLEQGGGVMAAWDTGCIYGDAEIVVNRGGCSRKYRLADVVHMFNGGKARNGSTWDLSIPTMVQREVDGIVRLVPLAGAWDSGVKQTFVVTTDSGRVIRATDEHPFMTSEGWLRLDELKVGTKVHVRGTQRAGVPKQAKPQYRIISWLPHHPHSTTPLARKSPHRVPHHRLVAEADVNGLTYEEYISRLKQGSDGLRFLDPSMWAVHHADHDHRNNDLANLRVLTHSDHHRLHAEEGKTNSVLYKVVTEHVVSIEPHGMEQTYDLSVPDDPHNFIANGFVVHNTGKSHLAMALSAMLFEDDLIDHVILVAEKTKIAKDEWPADIARFTRLSHRVHAGPKRTAATQDEGIPQVLIGTYETFRADLVVVNRSGKRKSYSDGWLMPYLVGKRVLVVFDESTKVKNRTGQTWIAFDRIIRQMRRKAVVRVLEMTATPIEKDYEDAFNQFRLADPKSMPLVKEFEEWFVKSRDPYDRPRYKSAAEMAKFAEMCRPYLLRVRKTDPAVIAEFPKQIEESRWFEMAKDQRDLYENLCDLQEPEDEEPMPGLNAMKRMACNHPASIIHSAKHGTSKLARVLLSEWGEDYLRSVSSTKTQGLLDYLEPIIHGQGDKAVVFSFFGPSLFPILTPLLKAKRMPFFVTHGGMTLDEVGRQREMFKQVSGPAILLSSDAGARGINLPQASYVVEYESALTYAMRTQRINRAHRIDSTSESVTCMTFIVRESVEEAIAEAMIKRNGQQDVLLEDEGEGFISALERKRMLQIRSAKRRAKP